MKNRTGEKTGWSGGWAGAFIWVAILSVVLICRGRLAHGLSGIALTAAGVAAITIFAPWRFPATPYWKLMLAPYGVFVLCIAWAVWTYGGVAALGLNWWNLLWLLPLLTPFGTLSKRKWSDGGARQNASACAEKPRP